MLDYDIDREKFDELALKMEEEFEQAYADLLDLGFPTELPGDKDA